MPVFLCFYARLIFLPPFRAQKETEFFRKQVMIHGLLCLLWPIPRPVAWSFCPGRRCIFPLYPPAKLGSPTGHIPPHAFQPIPAPGRRCIASLCPLAGLGPPTGRKQKRQICCNLSFLSHGICKAACAAVRGAFSYGCIIPLLCVMGLSCL